MTFGEGAADRDVADAARERHLPGRTAARRPSCERPENFCPDEVRKSCRRAASSRELFAGRDV
jgi:hypothetical protein